MDKTTGQANASMRAGRSTAKQLMGLPVISLSDGTRQGEVHDVVYHPEQGRLIGFFVRRGGGLFGGNESFWLGEESIHAIGEDAVTIDTPALLSAVEGNHPERNVEGGEPVLGKRLLTQGGKFLGNIDDVLIDRASRRVVAYEVSGGLWHDLMRGQTAVPIPQVLTIGRDAVIVPDTVQADVEASTGGLLGVTGAAKEKVAAAYEQTAQVAGQARAEVAEAIENREADYARGKTAARDVTDDTGALLVSAGEVITEDHIRRAEAAGQMHALAIAAGRAHASDVAETVREKVATAGATIREKAADLSEAAQDRQTQMLVGKTTGRAVASDGGLILIPADHVVTDADVAAARAAGKLGDLTAAVGAGAWESVKERVGDAYEGARDRIETDAPARSEPGTPPPIVVVEQPQAVVVQTPPAAEGAGSVATPAATSQTASADDPRAAESEEARRSPPPSPASSDSTPAG